MLSCENREEFCNPENNNMIVKYFEYFSRTALLDDAKNVHDVYL